MYLHHAISEADWLHLANELTLVEVPARSLLWRAGQVVDSVGFVVQGCFRFYFEKEHKDATIQFFTDGEFISDHESYVMGTPSRYCCQALGACKLIRIPREPMEEIKTARPEIKELERKILEAEFIRLRNERIYLQYATGDEKYRYILENRPHLLQLVPLHMLADFLAMTPQHLSRLRARQKGKQNA
ncbi:MAG: Crp/Fnr family transcriptional regulator [Sphingobacteriia bacterium]